MVLGTWSECNVISGCFCPFQIAFPILEQFLWTFQLPLKLKKNPSLDLLVRMWYACDINQQFNLLSKVVYSWLSAQTSWGSLALSLPRDLSSTAEASVISWLATLLSPSPSSEPHALRAQAPPKHLFLAQNVKQICLPHCVLSHPAPQSTRGENGLIPTHGLSPASTNKMIIQPAHHLRAPILGSQFIAGNPYLSGPLGPGGWVLKSLQQTSALLTVPLLPPSAWRPRLQDIPLKTTLCSIWLQHCVWFLSSWCPFRSDKQQEVYLFITCFLYSE